MNKIQTKNTHTFHIEPDCEGGTKQTVTIGQQNILPPLPRVGRRKAPPVSHLLIGFDTEYQTFEPVDRQQIEAGEAKNEVLSYQFSVKLVSKDDDADKAIETDGIIIPKSGERILLEEFIAFAVGALIDKFPSIRVPQDIYLVGHFTRVDLPAFSEFQNNARQMASNVRNTFVSIDRYTKLIISDHSENRLAEFKVRLRDTLLLAPTNAKSLADIGEIVGMPKIKLHHSPDEETRIKENMATYMANNWAAFRDYAINDAAICVEYAELLIRQNDELFDEFELPITLTTYGTKLVLAGWEKSGWNKDDILGRETIKVPKFNKNKRGGYFTTVTKNPYIQLVHYEQDFVIDSYHGGRSEQFVFGAAKEADWKDRDLSSAYTTAMSLIGFPQWEEIRPLDTLDNIKLTDLTFALVDFEFPDTVSFPTLPIRTANGIIFPRKGRSCCGAPEIFLAKRLGAKLILRRGVTVPADRSRPIFKEFIQDSIRRRSEHEKRTFHNLFWKEVGNSTYGKTAQGLRKRRVYDLREDDMVELPESQITQPFFASFITSYTRAVLGEIINSFPEDVSVFSVTTDGFLSDAKDHQINKALKLPLTRSFTKAREDLVGDDSALEIKHQIRQPIGWRTRGSATLQKGENENNIVLQQGGIKTNPLLDDEQENRRIVKLFLNRYPEQEMHFPTSVGVKDMIRYGADFVSRTITRKLGMEYDWKRRPVDPHNTSFEFDGQQFTHLSFVTKPLEDVEEFERVREAWDKFSRKPNRCLKTMEDFEQFKITVETGKLPKSVTAYLRKTDGDIERLRMDLTRAFKHQQAGFDKFLARVGRITHKQFVELLASVGVPCKITDLDNAKKSPFKPHQTLDEKRVRIALEKLKKDHIPELEIETLLVKE